MWTIQLVSINFSFGPAAIRFTLIWQYIGHRENLASSLHVFTEPPVQTSLRAHWIPKFHFKLVFVLVEDHVHKPPVSRDLDSPWLGIIVLLPWQQSPKSRQALPHSTWLPQQWDPLALLSCWLWLALFALTSCLIRTQFRLRSQSVLQKQGLPCGFLCYPRLSAQILDLPPYQAPASNLANAVGCLFNSFKGKISNLNIDAYV